MHSIRISFLLICLLFSSVSMRSQDAMDGSSEPDSKIQVLNFGTFHMGYTNDANTTEFDQNNKENQRRVHEIAASLAAFKPTIIVVETEPSYDAILQEAYAAYLDNPDMFIERPTEVELLAFEIGRIANARQVYGIDHQMYYNYRIAGEIENTVDSATVNDYYSNPLRLTPELIADEDTLSLLENLVLSNNDKYLDFLLTINADIMTYAATDENFEGADEAAKYYQRNLRMYTNLNRIPMNSDDRVFLLLGASHTAFFRDFIKRSPKYEMVDTYEYLK